jgi:hypothetical protein
LSVLLKTNDKQYNIKRKHLNELECKINKNIQEYVTGLNFNKKNNKNGNENNNNENDKKECFLLYNDDNENNFSDINDEVDNKYNENLLNENEKKLLYKKLKTKKNFYIKNNIKNNNNIDIYKQNSYSNLSSSFSSSNNLSKNLTHNKSQVLYLRNKNNFENLYYNAHKITQKTKVIREFKNKTKIMDNINFFSYNKSKWNHHNLFKSFKIKIKPKTFLPEIFLKKIKNAKSKSNEKNKEIDFNNIQNKVEEEIKKEKKEKEILLELKKHKLLNNTLNIMKDDIDKMDELIYNSRQIYYLGFSKRNSMRKKNL